MKKIIKYDDASWHFDGDFPKELGITAARTHMGFVIRWAAENKLLSNLLTSNFPNEINALKNNKITSSEFIEKCCDDKLTNDDFSEEGNLFLSHYYDDHYMDDYVDTSSDDLPTIYHEPDNNEKYQIVKEIINIRYKNWVNNFLRNS